MPASAHYPSMSSIRYHSTWIMHFPPGWQLATHSHVDWHHLVLVLDGHFQTRGGDRELTADPGEAVLYPVGLPHGHCNPGPGSLRMLSLQWQGGEDFINLEHFDVQVDRRGRLRHQLEWLAAEHPLHHPSQFVFAEAMAVSLLTEFGQLQRFEEVDLAEKVRRFAGLHLSEDLSLDDLAAISGLSKYHFARRFRSLSGETPMAMVNRLRVERARMLLYQTDDGLETIASAVGFADASALSHAFRRLTGVSPGSLRRIRQAGAG
jgi:AraC-like DNA-binding protein/mannose-6-phosphate isomerase-like protein (cupin superfamily)